MAPSCYSNEIRPGTDDDTNSAYVFPFDYAAKTKKRAQINHRIFSFQVVAEAKIWSGQSSSAAIFIIVGGTIFSERIGCLFPRITPEADPKCVSARPQEHVVRPAITSGTREAVRTDWCSGEAVTVGTASKNPQ